jgi:hypothetical protein
VEILFTNAKLAQTLNEEAHLLRTFDATTARQIRLRLAVLVSSSTLADVPELLPDGCHQLKTSFEQRFGVCVGASRRIIFTPTPPAPIAKDGQLDLRKVNVITILEIAHQV